MDELKFHNFIREEIMKECELLKDLETQINYLREVRAEYITNPPELDENIRRAPRLEIYLDEKIKLIDEKLKYKPLQKTKGKTNRSRKVGNIEEAANEFMKAFVKFHLNKTEKEGIFTLRKLEEYSDKYLDHSSWPKKYKDVIFWAQVEKIRIRKLEQKKEFSHEIVFILGAKLQDFIKPHLNKAKLINHRAAEKEEERAMYNAKYKEVPSLEFERNIEDFSENYNDDDSYEI
jgi:hypothetical protein